MPKFKQPTLSRDEILKLITPLLKDLPEDKYPMVAFGVRGLYGKNQRGVWDDANGFIERHPGGTFAVFPGNCDPTAPFKKGLGSLSPNQVLWFALGLHRGRKAFRQAKPCLVDRDGIGKRLNAPVSCAFNWHDSISATDTTSSLGCQTNPKAVFPAVRAMGYMFADKYYKGGSFPYILVDHPEVAEATAVTDLAISTGLRQINAAGIKLVKDFEGCKLSAYKDSVGVPTIGYGRTKGVVMGQKITQAQAEAFLKEDLASHSAPIIPMIKVPVSDNQFAALASFAFNLGPGALQKSTLLKKLNAKNFPAAAAQFLVWNKAGGKVLAGLTRRRKAERDLFLKA